MKYEMKYEAGSVVEQFVAEGKIEGKIQGKIEVALRLIKKGMSNQDISDITDRPINTIAELRPKQAD